MNKDKIKAAALARRKHYPDGLKPCTVCNKIKSLSEYYVDTKHWSGTQKKCKSCFLTPAMKAKRNAYKATLDGKYTTFKVNAKRKRGLECTLSKEQYTALIHRPCVYCNKYSKNKTVCGIDRIDSADNYTPENSVPCCFKCNCAKNDMNIKDFYDHIIDIYNHFILRK